MASDDREHPTDSAKSFKGHVKEVLGAVTGDRRVEAEGQVEEQVADPQGQESEEAVSRHEREVRQSHQDVPGGEPGDEGPLGT